SSDLNDTEKAELKIIKKHQENFLEDIQKINQEIAEILLEIDHFQQAQSCKHIQREKNMSIGRKKFNMDPVKGIQYLVEQKILSLDAEEVAKFLYQGEGLNKTAIGDYLGQRDPLNLQVLQAFVECHQFANLNLVQALRQFLWSFRLPGEAQKIDRMMEAFANWYCQCNPGIFQSTDACYILSFSVIMLNTSLHNPNVKDKPPFERFMSMNRGINNGADLQEVLLKDKEPLGIIPLENLSVQPIDDLKKPNCFELFNANCKGQKIKACKTDGDGRVVEGKHQSYKISAASQEDRDLWIEAIRTSITRDPFYDLVAARKKKVTSKK
ncbi:PREDICTED: cytohesin-4-like, partial [Thamnophis sirtalis]|uniref:Cytohesin-4-like n=1 Tax=Thamnophis sirtalis TaxID=35019 RepID=A0A6I9Z0C3_9SAUR